MEVTQTPQNPRNSVLAAFDSVNLINKTIPSTGVTLDDKIDIIKRNKEHLEIMMAKSWFTDVLINNEGNQIQTCIVNAQNFLNSNGG